MSPATVRQWPRLSHLIFAVGCASASLTLTNFEDIPDDVTLKACKNAYNTALDCTVDDFSNSKICSKKCRESLEEVQDAIIEKCASVTVDDTNSILYRAKKGQLLAVTCTNNSDDDDDDDEATSTTAAAASNTNKNQVSTSIITKRSSATASATATATSEPAQTTSLVLAGNSDDPTGVLESAVTSSSSASATETSSSSSGRGGDPFANNTSAGTNIKIGYATLAISALAFMVAIM